jgi:Ca-activated chloride channel homolog
MIRFSHEEYLWGLLIIPALFLVFYLVYRWKRKALSSLADAGMLKRIMPEASASRPWVKFSLFALAYACLVVGAANPQAGTRLEEVKKSGVELMILLDVSNSMLAKDLQPSRLEHAKRAIAQLIDNLHNDRIGLVVFAGDAYVQLPVTTDYAAAKLFLGTINTDMVPTQGTAIGAAIERGLKSLDFKNGMQKSIILITDGENHEDNAVDAAEEAKKKGVSVNVIGVGSPAGSPVPVFRNGVESGYRSDENGNTVITKLNEKMCREVAASGGGVYVRSTNGNSGLPLVMSEITKLQKKEYDNKLVKEFEDRFQVFLAIALFILCVEFFIAPRRNRRLEKINLFGEEK